MKYLTITHIHVPRSVCGYRYTVRIAMPKGKEHHALGYYQGMSPESCPRCKLRKQIENCVCGTCQGIK